MHALHDPSAPAQGQPLCSRQCCNSGAKGQLHLAGHSFVLCLAKGFLRAVSSMWLLLLGCHSVQEIQI